MENDYGFKYNLKTIPKKVDAADVGKALVAFIAPLNMAISKSVYDSLPDNMKSYWRALREDEVLSKENAK